MFQEKKISSIQQLSTLMELNKKRKEKKKGNGKRAVCKCSTDTVFFFFQANFSLPYLHTCQTTNKWLKITGEASPAGTSPNISLAGFVF